MRVYYRLVRIYSRKLIVIHLLVLCLFFYYNDVSIYFAYLSFPTKTNCRDTYFALIKMTFIKLCLFYLFFFLYQKRLNIFKLDILKRINSMDFYKNYEEQWLCLDFHQICKKYILCNINNIFCIYIRKIIV